MSTLKYQWISDMILSWFLNYNFNNCRVHTTFYYPLDTKLPWDRVITMQLATLVPPLTQIGGDDLHLILVASIEIQFAAYRHQSGAIVDGEIIEAALLDAVPARPPPFRQRVTFPQLLHNYCVCVRSIRVERCFCTQCYCGLTVFPH